MTECCSKGRDDNGLCSDGVRCSEAQPFALRCAARPPALSAEAAACAAAAAACCWLSTSRCVASMLGSRLQHATAALAVAQLLQRCVLPPTAYAAPVQETGAHRAIWHTARPVGSRPTLQAAAATEPRRRCCRPNQPQSPLLRVAVLSSRSYRSAPVQSIRHGQGRPAPYRIRSLRLRRTQLAMLISRPFPAASL